MTDLNLFEQAVQITKAHGYDILCEQVKELKAENERRKDILKGLVIKEAKQTWGTISKYTNTEPLEFEEQEWEKFKTENKL